MGREQEPSWHAPMRRAIVAAATGILTVSVAWAGAGLAPVPAGSTGHLDDNEVVAAPDGEVDGFEPAEAGTSPSTSASGTDSSAADGRRPARLEIPVRPDPDARSDPDEPDPQVRPGDRVPRGTAVVRAGEARRSIVPAPPEGQRWEQDRSRCDLLDLEATVGHVQGVLERLVSGDGRLWPVEPSCIFLGGYGIGPLFPMTSVEEHGLWVRAVAIEGTDGGTLVVVSVDGIGWLWERAEQCPSCGARAITERLGDELGIDPAGIWLHATHTHTGPDFMGAWGSVPTWYLEQVTAAIEDTVRDAVSGLRPAVLEAGEQIARDHNRDRRSTYHAAEEPFLAYVRALAVTPDGRRYLDERAGRPAVVGTLAAFAAHPTTRPHEEGVGDGDWPVRFEAAVDARDGGRTVHAQTGLGNLSAVGGTEMGHALAAELPAPRTGRVLQSAEVRVARQVVTHPVTNVPLSGLGLLGLVDRAFLTQPARASVGRSAEAPCASASAVSVDAPVAGAWIGDEVALSAGPGELFANLSNTVKERSGARVTLPLSQTNDALGYVGQSFEVDALTSAAGLGFVADGHVFVDYEDSYAIDVCFGDHVLDATLQLLTDLR